MEFIDYLSRLLNFYVVLKQFVLTIIFLNLISAQSQGEANNWYFGVNAGITFNNGAPEALMDGQLDTQEGCAAMSDSDGQLLFYTDGSTIYNQNHEIMQNGSGLLGDYSSTQSAIVAPYPNHPNQYFVFTVYHSGEPDGLRYSIVDMALDGGLGAVTSEKNIQIMTPVSEKINAVKHANGEDFWILTHGYGNDDFYAFLLSETGVNLTPVVSQSGIFLEDWDPDETIGVVKASPSGDKVVLCFYRKGVHLYDFDNTTGQISNHLEIYTQPRSYAAEFSPSGNVLYVSREQEDYGVWQYDLTAADIPASGVYIYQPSFWHLAKQMQLGPDEKIYVSLSDYGYIGVINNPEVVGFGCDYVNDGVYLGGNLGKSGLPAFNQSFFYAGFNAQNVCHGNAVLFEANLPQTYDSLIWDFGDGNTSVLENPNHLYAVPGNYDVQLTVTRNGDTTSQTRTISIYELPISASNAELRQCDDDLDGFSSFNLNEALEEISTNHENETITFYETETAAENSEDVINDINTYTNETVSSDTVWARVENGFGCYTVSEVNLIVTTTQIPSNFLSELYVCDGGADNQDGISTFDLSDITTNIESLFPPSQQLDIAYYKNEAEALSETNPIDNITNYQNLDSPFTENLYVRVDSTIDNNCLGLGEHISLYVESPPIANPISPQEQCDVDGDGVYGFDTSSIDSSLLSGQTNIEISYFNELGVPLSSPLPNPFLTNSQVVTARLSNMNSNITDETCYAETQIEFNVQSAAVAYSVPEIFGCDDDGDGIYGFDTSGIESSVLNGQTNMEVLYFDENNNQLSSPLPNPFVTASQTIRARVESQLGDFCYDETTIDFVVTTKPMAGIPLDHFVCDDLDNDGLAEFILSDYDDEVLNGQDASMHDIFYFASLDNAQDHIDVLPNSIVVSNTSTPVFAKISHVDNPQCYDIVSFNLGVHFLPIASQPDDIKLCDDQSNDKKELFNLNINQDQILNGLSPSETSITYHQSQGDAESGTNGLSTNFENTENPQTIYVRLENADFPDCFTKTSFQIEVLEQPVLEMPELWSICAGEWVEITADYGFDSYLWSTDETTRMITITESGNYEVTVSYNHDGINCETTKTIQVVNSDIAIITDIETTDWSQNNNSLVIIADGSGDYEYSIDGFDYQDSNEFTNLEIDDYTVYVRDKNGCGISTEDVYLLYYPKYFTPNGDGFHDFWQIKNSEKEPLNRLFIYDRYGKLLSELAPEERGWDGRYNGSNLPSNDYWFVLERQNGKKYTGHFALKR